MFQQTLNAHDGFDLAGPVVERDRPVPMRKAVMQPAPRVPVSAVDPVPVDPLPVAAGRYGAGRAYRAPVMLAVLAAHVVLVMLLLTVRQHFVHRQEAALTVVDLAPAPPPPAEEKPEPPQVVKQAVVSPRPIVEVPQRPLPTVQTMENLVVQPAAATVQPPAPAAQPAAPGIVQMSDLATRMIAGKAPRYPLESRRKREQGTVVLSLVLGLDGAVSSISILRSSGFERLDEAALDAVRRWRWQPTTRNGMPIMVKGTVEIPFVLQG